MVAASVALTTRAPDTDAQAAREWAYHILLIFSAMAAWGWVLLINIPLWDDWVLLSYSEAGSFLEFFRQMGRVEQYGLVAPLAALAEPRAWVAVALVVSCAIPSLVYVLLRHSLRWPAIDAFWGALLTGLAPLNQARFILSTIPYALSSLFFLLALALLVHDLEKPSVARRIIITVLMLMAVSTNSFLVLAWVAPALVGIAAWRRQRDHSSLLEKTTVALKSIIGRGELLLLPPLYWAAKQLLEPTYGLYANYNKFRMSLPLALKETVITVFDQLKGGRILLPNSADLPELLAAAFVAILIFAFLARSLHVRLAGLSNGWSGSPWIVRILTLLAAFALAISALFPYVMVGQPPRFSGLWETRHQTTLMLASGFAIIAVLRAIAPQRIVWICAATTSAVFLLLDLSFTHRMVSDARETAALLDLFKQQPSSPGTMILVVEDDRTYRALDRFFPFYELSFLVNGGKSGPNLAISNREVLDPSTGSIVQSAVPAVVSTLSGLCESHRGHPQYGFEGFSSNGQIETARLVANQAPPGLLKGIRQALAGIAASSADLVRIERSTKPIAGACRGPCCIP